MCLASREFGETLATEQTASQDESAVVLGCGIAGLMAAAALRNHFDDITIVERDTLPKSPSPRKGVPQDEQLHNILGRAQMDFEHLIPGVLDNLRKAGAADASVGDQTHVHELGIAMPERELGLRLMSAWRPSIEHVMRGMITEDARVHIKGVRRAVGVRLDQDGAIGGAVIETEKGQELMPASMVVDATGSASHALRWLEACNSRLPTIEERPVNQWYVSTVLERPKKYKDNTDFWLSLPNPPFTRGGLISPTGISSWYLSLSGRSGDTPPRTIEEVKAYAATLEDEQAIATLIKDAVALGAPKLFRKPTASIRRYDQLDNPIPGFIPIGDSIASLNPLFGQGMSVAAWQARELDALFTRGKKADLNTLTVGYLGRAVEIAQTAMNLGMIVDQKVLGPGSDDNPAEVALRYGALARLIEQDPDLHRRYVGIWHLLESPDILQEPELLARLDLLK